MGKRLAWYAEHFNLVEVNSTFYSVPTAAATARWAEQTPDGFVFDVKLHQLLSRHSTPVNLLPADLRRLARVRRTKADLTPELEAALVENAKTRGMAPEALAIEILEAKVLPRALSPEREQLIRSFGIPGGGSVPDSAFLAENLYD